MVFLFFLIVKKKVLEVVSENFKIYLNFCFKTEQLYKTRHEYCKDFKYMSFKSMIFISHINA